MTFADMFMSVSEPELRAPHSSRDGVVRALHGCSPRSVSVFAAENASNIKYITDTQNRY